MKKLFLGLLLASRIAMAQTVEYEKPTTRIPLVTSAPVAQDKTALAVQGNTLLLSDAKSNVVYRLPDMQVLQTLPPGPARLGANGTQVAIYRQKALEIYSQGHVSRRWKQPEPLWFGDVDNQWLVVSAKFIQLGARKIPFKMDKQAQVFGAWFEDRQLQLSTTDSQGSRYLKFRLKDGKPLEPEVIRMDISVRLVTAHFELNGQFNHPGDTFTNLSLRPYQALVSTNDYFPTSLSEGGGRAAYLLDLQDEHISDNPRDLVEVLDPKSGQRWTWEGPPPSACALSGDGKILVVLAAGKVYLQQLSL